MKTNPEYGYIGITVDMEKDFCTPEGALYVADSETLVGPINVLNAAIRELGGLVLLTRDWHPDQTNHFEKFPVHCVANTTGAEFHDDLVVLEEDIIISKGTEKDTDGFSAIDCKAEKNGKTLREIIIEQLGKCATVVVIVYGVATEFCDHANVLDIANEFAQEIADGRLVLVALAKYMKPVNEEDGIRAIAEMEDAGALLEIPDRFGVKL